MKRDHYWRNPKRARVKFGDSAWWYANKGGIEVYLSIPGVVMSCQITRKTLENYLKRSRSRGDGGGKS